MSEVHEKSSDDSEWNCKECSYQTNNEISLKKHKTEAHTITCTNCGKTFNSKPSLMNHRKREHLNIIKQCRYAQQSECAFGDECWYRHTETNISSEKKKKDNHFKCNICEMQFETKNNVMKHRKTDHVNSVVDCKKYMMGRGMLPNEMCWYSHKMTVTVTA